MTTNAANSVAGVKLPARGGIWVPLGLCGLTAIVAALDYVTGDEIRFYLFYLFPLMIGTWLRGWRFAVGLSIASAFAWAVSDLLTHRYIQSWHLAWNAAIQILCFLGVSALTWEIRVRIRMQGILNARLQQALDQARTLTGLLPICAWCKKIRDDQGYWQQVEKYISEHTEATFTHGICPHCAAGLTGGGEPRQVAGADAATAGSATAGGGQFAGAAPSILPAPAIR